MPRYSIIVEYIGTNYAGSQIQPDETTVQSELEKAISTLIIGGRGCRDNESTPQNRLIKTVFSGRTDKGVHSTGQVVHFDSEKTIVASKFINSINGILPSDLSVKSIEEVDDTFHSQLSAKYRRYQYKIVNRRFRSAWDSHSLLVRKPLELGRMNESLSYLIGEHDFSSFKSLRTANPAKDCIVYKACATRNGDEIVIELVANRFLYNMVRTIVGTLLQIENQELEPEFMKEVLEAKDRTKAGPTISPDGLSLIEVGYQPYENNQTSNHIK